MPPLPFALLFVAGLGLALGSLVNWATYTLAWNPRPISPWASPPSKAPQRRWHDRLPVVGWFGLRREAKIHGDGFWIRPIIVELCMAVGLAWLYWWEVDQQRLVARQIAEQLGGAAVLAPEWTTIATFASHSILISLMAAASLIDIDERIIPDEITVVGTLVGLILAAAVPMALLPDVAMRSAPTTAAVEVATGIPPAALRGNSLYVEPVTPVSPSKLPAVLGGAPHWQGLAIGLGCATLWCFALTPRYWRRRRGVLYGLGVLFARVARELRRKPLAWIWIATMLLTVGVWYRGGAAWTGLFTALVGMVGASLMIWGVRIVGSAALQKEAMGFGDVTLMMMIGAYLGWQAGIFIFFIAPFAGLVAGIFQLVLRRENMIPYGPYLCLGAVFVVVFWAEIWHDGANGQRNLFLLWWLVPAVLGVCLILLGGMLGCWRIAKERMFAATDD